MDKNFFALAAPYLSHPLVLTGFTLFVFFGIHRQLLRSGLLSQASARESAGILRLLLKYGFWIALTLVVAGVLLQLSESGLILQNNVNGDNVVKG